jgi:hypothetical protein
VAIDWSDNQKRKALRQALEFVYPSLDALDGFIYEELNENLAAIAGQGSLITVVRKLIRWAIGQGRIDELFEAFCNENLDNPGVAQKINEIQPIPLVPPTHPTQKIPDSQWDELFQPFSPWDFANAVQAFLNGFNQVFNFDFKTLRPDCSPPNSLEDVRELLEAYDNPTLAVRFVAQAISRLRQEHPQRDLSSLEAWRDRVAAAHCVSPITVPAVAATCQGYLLVSLQETGQRRKSVPQVNVFTELHITGKAHPHPLSIETVKCFLSQVPQHLQTLVKNAEETLRTHCNTKGVLFDQITLELFLSSNLIETDVSQWPILNRQGEKRPLMSYRPLMVRSLNRAEIPETRDLIQRAWQTCVNRVDAAQQFHVQRDCPRPGDCNTLKDVPGMKLIAELPPERRQSILNDIADGALPIVLWFSYTEDCSPNQRLAAMDALLDGLDLTNVAEIAQRWRDLRRGAVDPGIQHLRLLCDCPDRWPQLPDPYVAP